MKTKNIIFSLIAFIVLSSSCKQQNQTMVNENELSVNIENITSMDTLYSTLPEISLPFTFDKKLIDETPDYTRLPESLSYLFPNIQGHQSNNAIAKLPQYHNLKPIIIYYCDNSDQVMIDLYTLSPELKVLQTLQLYSVEGEGKSENLITRKFEISDDYTIHVYKELDDTLIESLYYTIDDQGNFVERRDGKTRITAFETFDNNKYYVESYIWDYNSTGGLEKKDLEKKIYEITADGKVKESN